MVLKRKNTQLVNKMCGKGRKNVLKCINCQGALCSNKSFL